ncbi:MAG: AAA family ATPase, partial [Marmoricola sp.]|nr:AAA family ATPase [Marmoricola sp.]
MIEDLRDRRLALGATGLLRTFNAADVLNAADVHVAQRLGALVEEADETVLLATALAVRAVRAGSTCLDLDTVADLPVEHPEPLPWPAPEEWITRVGASPLVDQQLLRLVGSRLYLDRYWREEGQVCDDLVARLRRPAPEVDATALDAGVLRIFPREGYDEQRAAARAAASQWTTVLTGGPGTGKTTTVAGLLALVAEQHERTTGQPPRIALCAPTGKAAARLQEAVQEEVGKLGDATDRERVSGLAALTLHRLLGWRPDSRVRFRHHRANRLPHDVVVVDETSMVSLTMMARLLEAVSPDARLVLVGDPD